MHDHTLQDHTDFLVIGGGTAGAILATRLSSDPSRKVTLVEAGADTPPGSVPADIADTFPRAYSNPAYAWPGLTATGVAGSAPRSFTQARVMGGGSSMMGMWALRGLAADYDGWRECGATGWGWSDVAPYFQRLQASEAAPGAFPIRRIERRDWPAYVQALQKVAADCGYPGQPDINGSERDGFFAIPLSQDGSVRGSSTHACLTPAVRRRENLQILAQTEVTALSGTGREISGARAMRQGETISLTARQTILCGGAIHSPVLLLRSGIGPAAELASLEFPVRIDLAGVGRNLQNHAGVNLGLTLAEPYRQHRMLRNYGVACMRVSSGLPSGEAGDLLLAFIGRTAMRPIGRSIAIAGVFLYAPTSRGAVTLRRASGALSTDIRFNLLDTDADRARIAHGVEVLLRLLNDERLRDVFHEVFLLPATPPLHRLNRPGAWAALQASLGHAALAAGRLPRRALLKMMLGKGRVMGREQISARALEFNALLRESVTPLFHVAGTCAMGAQSDTSAVVDSQCRVRGVSGLRVADASIMPRLPRANTFLPVAMIAERAADLILAGGDA